MRMESTKGYSLVGGETTREIELGPNECAILDRGESLRQTSIWERWRQGQLVEVVRGPFEHLVGVLQEASGENEGRIDKASVLQIAFVTGERVSVVWLAEDDCRTPIGREEG